MKPNRPRSVSSSRNSITVSWDPFRLNSGSWYLLEKKDRLVGWHRVYMGFKTETEVGPLAPGDYYEFRLKAAAEEEESEYSDTLFAATKDDVIPVAQLHRAVENGPVASLRKTLGQRPSAVDVGNKLGQTPLHLAILKNNVSFMGILLNHGADVGNAEPGSGRTPLMVAAQRGLQEPSQLLAERGASWQTKDRNGLTAFNYAVDNSHRSILELALEEGADVRTLDRHGWSPLMRGILLKSSPEVLSLLLENGSDPNESDDRGQTALMQAVLSNRPEVVELLLKNGADVTPRNVYGRSAYDMAKSSANEGIGKISYLLATDADEEETEKETRRRRPR